MITLKVEEMHCEKCVERIHKVLKEADIEHEVALEDKTVRITGGESCAKKAIEELEDIGFEAVIV